MMRRVALACSLLLLFVAAAVSGRTMTIELFWCKGTRQFDNVATSIVWEDTPHAHNHLSTLSYTICSAQNRDISSLEALRLRSSQDSIDHAFRLCNSAIECKERARVRSQVNGLFCVTGEIPLAFRVSAAPDPVTVSLLDKSGIEFGEFCNVA
jgi:hypothetical protein